MRNIYARVIIRSIVPTLLIFVPVIMWLFNRESLIESILDWYFVFNEKDIR